MKRSIRHPIDDAILDLTNLASEAGLNRAEAGRVIWRCLAGRLVSGRVPPDRLDAWFGTTPGSIPESITRYTDGLDPSAADLGDAFERTAHLRLEGTAKRDAGMYYTPGDLAKFTVEQIVGLLSEGDRPADQWRIIDPAGGSGAFAAAVVEKVAEVLALGGVEREAAETHALLNCVYLIDSDDLAVAVARAVLLARFGSECSDLESIERHIVRGDAVIGGPFRPEMNVQREVAAFAWDLRFREAIEDGGFDAVVGNPPWGAIKPSVREFAATIDPRLLDLEAGEMRALLDADHRHTVAALAGRQRSYSSRLRASGYEHQGAGDTEFYRYFVELGQSLLRADGVLGLVVPSAFQRAAGAAPLRTHLLATGAFYAWLDFINTRGIFKIHKMFRFSVLVWRRGATGGIRRAAFGLTSVDEATVAMVGGSVPISSRFLRTVSPVRMTVPDVRSPEALALYARLHRRHPALGETLPDAWSVRFRREVDMTNDAGNFVATNRALREGAAPLPDGSWLHPDLGPMRPVFEGRMVHQFDAAAKGHVEGHGRSALWELLGPQQKEIRPRYLIPSHVAAEKGIPLATRSAFCDITGHANERTVLAALVPGAAVCGNKVPTCVFDSDDPDLPLVWLSLANSFVMDWMARRRVSTTLNYFHWEELPFPRVDPRSDIGQSMVDGARALTHNPGRPWTMDLAARGTVRANLDVGAAVVFGLDLDEMTLVFEDFPLLDRGAPNGHGGVTRDYVLAGLAREYGAPETRLSEIGLNPERGPDSLDERLEWHADGGAVPYVPGEFARSSLRSA